MSTLHDRITALADEWEASVDGLVAKGTNYDDGQAAYAAWAAFRLRAVLAETAPAQPEPEPLTECPRCRATDGMSVTTPDAWRCPSCGVVRADYPSGWKQPVEPEPRVCDGCTGEYPDGDPGVIHKHYGEHCACGWFGPSWQAHRATCEREALVRLIEAASYKRLTFRGQADAVLAAGFRRSRPEATHTVTAEQVEEAAQHDAVVAGIAEDAGASAYWIVRMVLAALGVTVADAPGGNTCWCPQCGKDH